MTTRFVWDGVGGPGSVTLTEGGEVVVEQGGAMARVTRCGLAEAFAIPHFVPELAPEARFACVQEMARRLAPNEVRTARDALRVAFYRAYDSSRVAPETVAYLRTSAGTEPRARALRLDGHGLYVAPHANAAPAQVLPDEVFLHGPPLPWAPAQVREALRERLAAALREGGGVDRAHGFPRLDHGRIARRTWTWDQRKDGETTLSIGPGAIVAGYVYGHDQGEDAFALEAVLTGDPRVRLGAPPEVAREVTDALEAARVPFAGEARVSVESYRAMRTQARDLRAGAPRTTLSTRAAPVMLERAWAGRAAKALLGSLKPDACVAGAGTTFDGHAHGRVENWGDDVAWDAGGGAGLLVGARCFGGLPGDGVNDVFHVLDGRGGRVVFERCTDSTQVTLTLALTADDSSALEALAVKVSAFVEAYGFARPTRHAPS